MLLIVVVVAAAVAVVVVAAAVVVAVVVVVVAAVVVVVVLIFILIHSYSFSFFILLTLRILHDKIYESQVLENGSAGRCDECITRPQLRRVDKGQQKVQTPHGTCNNTSPSAQELGPQN